MFTKKGLALLFSCFLFSTTSVAQNIGFGTDSPTHRFHVVGSIRFQSSFLAGNSRYLLVVDQNGVIRGIPLISDTTSFLTGYAQWKSISTNDNWGNQTAMTQMPIIGIGTTTNPITMSAGNSNGDILQWDGSQWQIISISSAMSGSNVLFRCPTISTNYYIKYTGNDTVCNSIIYDNSQSVGIGTTTPSASAILDVNSTSGGVLIPRMTTAQRNAIPNPANGLIIFNTDNSCIEIYNGSSMQWLLVSCPTACSPCDTCPVPQPGGIVGPASVCPDVNISYFANMTGGNTYMWGVPDGWRTISIGDSGLFHVGWQGGWLYASACNECGCSYDSIFVSILPYPARPTITASATNVCSGSQVTLTASPATNPNYVWEVWDPLINQWQVISGVSASSITVTVPYFPLTNYGSSYQDRFRVRACGSNGCCGEWSFSVTVSFQTNCRFCYAYGTNGTDILNAVVELSDGSVIAGGYVNARTEAVLLKTKPTGDTLWTLRITIGSSNAINDIVLLPNDDIIAVGKVDNSMFLARVNPSGNIVWLKKYDHPSSGTVIPYGANLSQNGTYVLVTGDYAGNMGVWEVDLSGNITYSEALPLLCCSSVGYDVIQPSGSNVRFVAVGRTPNVSKGLIFKVYYNTWATVSVRICTTATVERFTGIVEDPNDKHLILSGHGPSFNRFIITKLDSAIDDVNGVVVYWTNAIDQGGTGDLEMANGITPTDNSSNVVIVGQDSVAAGNVSDVFAVKVSSSGAFQWSRYIGNQGTTDAGMDVVEVSNNDLVIAGNVRNAGTGDDLFLTRVSGNGTSNSACGSNCASGPIGTQASIFLSCSGAKISTRQGAALIPSSPPYSFSRGLNVTKICP